MGHEYCYKSSLLQRQPFQYAYLLTVCSPLDAIGNGRSKVGSEL